MTAELDDYPECVICGRPETYAHGVWFCRHCDKDDEDR